jgi:ABC-type transporter Mla subunit MlaD
METPDVRTVTPFPAKRRLAGALAASWLLTASLASAAKPLDVVVDFDNSKGLETGAPVRWQDKRIGTVTAVGFGPHDTVEVRLHIDEDHRKDVRRSSTFVIHEKQKGEDAWVEYFLVDPASPTAENDARFAGSRSVVEVWLRRGRINAEEMNRALSKGVDEFHRNLEEMQRSPEWAKFRDQIAKLAAELTVTGNELSRLMDDQLPKLQKQLDDLYLRYQQELDRKKRESPGS